MPADEDAPGGLTATVEEKDAQLLDRRSSLELVRDVLLSLIRVVEDSTELLTVSVREELTRFRDETEKRFIALAMLVLGVALLDTALAMFLAEWLASWPLALTGLGVAHLIVGAAVYARAPEQRPES